MAKYDRLKVMLTLDGRPRIELTFSQIDNAVGGLPPSALQYREWWANQKAPPVQADAWGGAGYLVDHVDFAARRVRFVKAI